LGLVENSLGRLWMLNRPNSKLVQVMDYYIKPEQEETDFLKVGSPEELKICDPACGSGHMLVYAFDLLYAIYEEEGYEPSEIPEKILTNNLFGIEIDERAGELAAFALTMKARSKHRRFLRKPVQPNICVLENIHFEDSELKSYMDAVGRNLFTINLANTLRQFEEADNFGSLIRPAETEVTSIKRQIEEKDIAGNLFLFMSHQKVMQVLKQADYLSPKYHVVIANPPYMGGKGMNGRLGAWAKDNYPDSKSDMFAMFIERGLEMVPKFGYSAMVTMQSWMFLSSYEKLRARLLAQTSIEGMAHMANMVMGIAFGTAATVWKKSGQPLSKGAFCYVEYENIGKNNIPTLFPPKNSRNNSASNDGFFHTSVADFKKIPGSPIAYWVSENVRKVFSTSASLNSVSEIKQGLATCNNDLFLRLWFEVSDHSIGYKAKSPEQALESNKKWYPYNKGGGYRKWYGNNEYLVNWQNGGQDIHEYSNLPIDYQGAPVRAKRFYFREGITYGLISSFGFSARRVFGGFVFDVGGSMIFPEININKLQGFLTSKLTKTLITILNPTMNYQVGDIQKLPIIMSVFDKVEYQWEVIIAISKADWDSYETSWDFSTLPLLQTNHHQPTLKAAYTKISTHWHEMTLEMQRLEEENNRIFIEAYGLQDELTSEVPLKEITLSCNPHYRYGGDKTEQEFELLLQTDTMKEFISYAVGCMFGRYSLDKPGLVLANQGETIEGYLGQIPEPTFPADDDNVIPMLDGDWFTDDISERFKKFLKVTFGEDYYEENLKFIEQSLGKDIRKYFLKDFYPDHLKRYKKRPIYWLFSSPKGSFNALIYMHRYRSDTVSVVLNDYLREFRTKLTAHKSHLEQVSISGSASAGEKTKALKEIETLSKIIQELEEYERTVLYPLATQKVEIDLDDGVKVNYQKFGAALKKIPGLEAKED